MLNKGQNPACVRGSEPSAMYMTHSEILSIRRPLRPSPARCLSPSLAFWQRACAVNRQQRGTLAAPAPAKAAGATGNFRPYFAAVAAVGGNPPPIDRLGAALASRKQAVKLSFTPRSWEGDEDAADLDACVREQVRDRIRRHMMDAMKSVRQSRHSFWGPHAFRMPFPALHHPTRAV